MPPAMSSLPGYTSARHNVWADARPITAAAQEHACLKWVVAASSPVLLVVPYPDDIVVSHAADAHALLLQVLLHNARHMRVQQKLPKLRHTKTYSGHGAAAIQLQCVHTLSLSCSTPAFSSTSVTFSSLLAVSCSRLGLEQCTAASRVLPMRHDNGGQPGWAAASLRNCRAGRGSADLCFWRRHTKCQGVLPQRSVLLLLPFPCLAPGHLSAADPSKTPNPPLM